MFFVFLISIVLPFINGEIVIVNEFFNIPDYNNLGSIVQFNSPDIIQSISDSTLKLRLLPYKILEGMFFHHHMSFIEPAWLLSQGDSTPIHQYGILTSKLISSLAILSNNAVSLDFYMKVNYGSYIVFYLFVLILLISTIKEKLIIIIYFSLIIFLIYILGFLILYMTPTVSPLRQIFSPLILIFVLYSFKSINKKSSYLLLICLVIYSFYNFHMAFFMCLSIFLVNFIALLKKKYDRNMLLLTFFSSIVIFGLNIYFDFNSNNTFSEIGIYFGSDLKFGSILFILILLSCLYLIIYQSNSLITKDKQLQFLCYFSAMTIIFYAWNPSIVHFSQIFWILLFTLLFWVDNYVKPTQVFLFSTLIIILVMLFPAYESYKFKKDFYYDEIIKQSKVYVWELPNAKIKSTINPEPIYDSCEKFKTYSLNKRVVMISEYDSFLPYVCGFNNKGYYPQLGQSLISTKFHKKAIEFYRTAEFEILFVDKTISENSMDKGNFGFYSLISDYVFKKINYISQIKKTFDLVSNDFILIDKGKLINVYKRKIKK